MITFAKVVAKLVGKALSWAWANKSTIMTWIRNGLTLDAIVQRVRNAVR